MFHQSFLSQRTSSCVAKPTSVPCAAPYVASVFLAAMLSTEARPVVFALASGSPTNYNLRCHNVWDTASADNSIDKCIVSFLESNYPLLFPAAIPVLFGAIFILFFILIFVGRCFGGCGSRHRRPGADCCCEGEGWDEVPTQIKDKVYPREHVRCIRVCVVIVAVLSALAAVTIPFGIARVQQGWAYFTDHIDADVLVWVLGVRDLLYVTLQSPTTQQLPPQVPIETFDVFDDAVRQIETVRKDLDRYSNKAILPTIILSYVLGFVPMILSLMTLLFAFLGIRKGGPVVMLFVHFVFAVVYMAMGAALLAAAMGVLVVVGEVAMQAAGAPGVFSLWLVPRCNKLIPFFDFQSKIQDSLASAASSGCNTLLGVCDDRPSFVSGGKPFYCPSLARAGPPSSACRSFSALDMYVSDTSSKSGSGICTTSPCTVSECAATACTNGTTAKNASVATVELVGITDRIQSAASITAINVDCNVLVDRALLPFAELDSVAHGLLIAGSGASFALILVVLGSILLCKGQKVFIHYPDPADEDDGGESAHEPTKGVDFNRHRKRRNDKVRQKEGGPSKLLSPKAQSNTNTQAIADESNADHAPHPAGNETPQLDLSKTADTLKLGIRKKLARRGSRDQPLLGHGHFQEMNAIVPPSSVGAGSSGADPSLLDSTLGLRGEGPNRRAPKENNAALDEKKASPSHRYPTPALMAHSDVGTGGGREAGDARHSRPSPLPPLPNQSNSYVGNVHDIGKQMCEFPPVGSPFMPRRTTEKGAVLSNNSMATMELTTPRYLDPLNGSGANFSFSQRPQPMRGWAGQSSTSISRARAAELALQGSGSLELGGEMRPKKSQRPAPDRAQKNNSVGPAMTVRPLVSVLSPARGPRVDPNISKDSDGAGASFANNRVSAPRASFVGVGTEGSPRRRTLAEPLPYHYPERDSSPDVKRGPQLLSPPRGVPPPSLSRYASFRGAGTGSPRLVPAFTSNDNIGYVPSISDFNYQHFLTGEQSNTLHYSFSKSFAESEAPGSAAFAGRGGAGSPTIIRARASSYNPRRASRNSIFFPDNGGRGTAGGVGLGGVEADGLGNNASMSFNLRGEEGPGMLSCSNRHSRFNPRNAADNPGVVGSFSFRAHQLDT